MKNPTVTLLLLCSVLFGCNPEKVVLPERSITSWEEKKEQILDSLSICFSIQDSIICLNRFAHRDALHGGITLNCDSIAAESIPANWSAEKWYNYLLKDSVSVFCGCNTHMANSLYREFMPTTVFPHGFGIGEPNFSDGHYISLLAVREKNVSRMYLADAMFNSVYTLQDGTLGDARYLIYLARKNRTDKFRIHAAFDNASFLMTDTNNLFSQNAIYDLNFPYSIRKSVNADYPYVLSCPRTLEHYLEFEFSATYARIASYYGKDSLLFKNVDDFKMCVLFFSDIYGPYATDVGTELDFYCTAPLDSLDQIFRTHNLDVSSGT